MTKQTRRNFIKHTAASTLFSALAISGTKSSGRILGANDTIRIGVCGLNGRGKSHVKAYADMKHVQISHLIDCDSNQFAARKKHVEQAGGASPTCAADVREALDDKSLDAISIATCNHTHSLMTVWACQAGKDVYVEKPISHNLFEGRQCVRAARKYDRVVQHGTQRRSNQAQANEIAAVQSGKYGRLLVSKGYCCKPRWSIGTKPTATPPENVQFDLWLGPAPKQPYHANLVPYNWHWFWDFGSGDTGNQGVHEMDVARWAIPGATLPQRVWSLGGRLGYQDQGQTPNMQLTGFEYQSDKFGEVLLLFETRGLVGKHEGYDLKVLNEYYTDEGVIRNRKFYPHGGGEPVDVTGGKPRRVTRGGPFGSFIAAMRSRQPEDINADAEVGHYSAALCHLANISYRLGKPVPFNAKTETLGDNSQVVESLQTIKDNCSAVGLDLNESTYQLGRVLQVDAASEKFVNDDQANRMLTRDYRPPFVVPKEV